MNKIILIISAVLMLGWASQVSALPIVHQGGNQDIASAINYDTSLSRSPSINFTNLLPENAGPSFDKFVTLATNKGAVDQGSAWWLSQNHHDGDKGPNGKGHGKKGHGPKHHGPRINPGDGNPSPTPVPEPATMLLFGTGLIGLAFISRKGTK